MFSQENKVTSPILYHYTSSKSLKAICNNGKLRLYSHTSVDDKLDALYGTFEAAKFVLSNDFDKWWGHNYRKDLNGENLIEDISKNSNVKYYSMSFCEDFDNEVLWRTYAKEGGVAIGFNREDIERRISYVEGKDEDYPFDLELELTKVFYESNNMSFLNEEIVNARRPDFEEFRKRRFVIWFL